MEGKAKQRGGRSGDSRAVGEQPDVRSQCCYLGSLRGPGLFRLYLWLFSNNKAAPKASRTSLIWVAASTSSPRHGWGLGVGVGLVPSHLQRGSPHLGELQVSWLGEDGRTDLVSPMVACPRERYLPPLALSTVAASSHS